MQYKRNVIEGTVHRVFRSTSTWENSDQALEKKPKQWIENQYPKNWLDRVLSETLNREEQKKKKQTSLVNDTTYKSEILCLRNSRFELNC